MPGIRPGLRRRKPLPWKRRYSQVEAAEETLPETLAEVLAEILEEVPRAMLEETAGAFLRRRSQRRRAARPTIR